MYCIRVDLWCDEILARFVTPIFTTLCFVYDSTSIPSSPVNENDKKKKIKQKTVNTNIYKILYIVCAWHEFFFFANTSRMIIPIYFIVHKTRVRRVKLYALLSIYTPFSERISYDVSRLTSTQPRGLRRFRRGQQQQRTYVHRHGAQGSATTAPVSPPRSDYVRSYYTINSFCLNTEARI